MSKYREIDVKKQRSMTFCETFGLCIKGVKHRMFRSLLTLAVVVLAVAFFMFLLSESVFVKNIGSGVSKEIKHDRRSQHTLTRISSPASEMVTIRRLSAAYVTNDERAFGEFSSVTGIAKDEVVKLASGANQERIYADWFDSIPSGRRLILVHKNTGRGAIRYALSDRDSFAERLAPMIDLRIPGKQVGLMSFFDAYSGYAEQLTRFNTLWNRKVSAACKVIEEMKGGFEKSDAEWIVTRSEEELELFRSRISELGFAFGTEDVKLMQGQFREALVYSRVYAFLGSSSLREEWTRVFRETTVSPIDEKFEKLNDGRARSLLRGNFTDEELDLAYEHYIRERRLMSLERKLSAVMTLDDASAGLNGRQVFLLVISFVVCMVGITNAMLMSITERFREIATMKCLGATDGYILLQFMMEAALQGFCGGIVGVVLGFLIAFLRGLMSYGGYLFKYWSTSGVLACSLFSLIVGIVLAVLASVQPSWSASRMAPMEAMRVE